MSVNRIQDADPLRLESGIGELVGLMGVTPRAIRYYEERGLIETRRDGRNYRRFDRRNRARLHLIATLRAGGLGRRDIRRVLDLEDV